MLQKEFLLMLVRTADWHWPLLVAFIRWPLLTLAGAIVILIYHWSGIEVGLYAGAVWATLTVSLVNLLCLALLLWRGRVERFRLRDLMGFRRDWVWLRFHPGRHAAFCGRFFRLGAGRRLDRPAPAAPGAADHRPLH